MPRFFHRATGLLGAFLLLTGPALGQGAGDRKTENVVLVTIDGLRWQEVFAGAQEDLIDEEAGRVSADAQESLRSTFWRTSPSERREALLPFLWQTVVAEGQLFGDHSAGGEAACVTNGKDYSYPGYSEILVGMADDRIASNAKKPNPNATVLEFLQSQAGLEESVAVFASWDVFPWIVNSETSGVFTNAGWSPLQLSPETPAQEMLNELMRTTAREWEGVRFDSFTYQAALEYLERQTPRVLYLALGEPDDWAHQRRYDRYLVSARRCDDMIRELWEWLQSHDRYRDKTTLIVTTDHGRGRGAEDWTSHGSDVDGADEAWIAVLGPDTPTRGVRTDARVSLANIAATVAAALGYDWSTQQPGAGAPLPVLLAR